MLEEQLVRSRKRSEHVMTLEAEIIKYKQKLNDMALERDVDKTKLQELLDENTHLQLATKTFNSSADGEKELLEEEEESASGDNSLSEQLTNNAQVMISSFFFSIQSFIYVIKCFHRPGQLNLNWKIVVCSMHWMLCVSQISTSQPIKYWN